MARDKNVAIERFVAKKSEVCRAVHPKDESITCTRDTDHKSLSKPGAAMHYDIFTRTSWR